MRRNKREDTMLADRYADTLTYAYEAEAVLAQDRQARTAPVA